MESHRQTDVKEMSSEVKLALLQHERGGRSGDNHEGRRAEKGSVDLFDRKERRNNRKTQKREKVKRDVLEMAIRGKQNKDHQ